MENLFSALGNLFSLFAFLAVLLLIARFARRFIRAVFTRAVSSSTSATGRITTSRSQTASFRGDYDRVARIISPTEQSFYRVLRDALPGGYTIMVQVALNRLVTVRNLSKTRHYYDKRWNHIAQKSLDFVVIRESDMAPVVVIELDDASHLRDDRAQRDDLVDAILTDAGLPIIHHRVLPQYDRMALQSQILGYLQRS